MLGLIFLSMAFNFGFLLMAIDRLRNEVADLALLDDLTGVGNRRQLVQRLTEECARSERNSEPFALLVIDLDGFKQINDTHGHAAGDACLQHFTLMAQTRLAARRPAGAHRRRRVLRRAAVLDLARGRDDRPPRARRLPRRTPRAASAPTFRSRSRSALRNGPGEIGAFPDRLIAAADHALYAAKKDGKNRYAVYDPAPPPLAPDYARAAGTDAAQEA